MTAAALDLALVSVVVAIAAVAFVRRLVVKSRPAPPKVVTGKTLANAMKRRK